MPYPIGLKPVLQVRNGVFSYASDRTGSRTAKYGYVLHCIVMRPGGSTAQRNTGSSTDYATAQVDDGATSAFQQLQGHVGCRRGGRNVAQVTVAIDVMTKEPGLHRLRAGGGAASYTEGKRSYASGGVRSYQGRSRNDRQQNGCVTLSTVDSDSPSLVSYFT